MFSNHWSVLWTMLCISTTKAESCFKRLHWTVVKIELGSTLSFLPSFNITENVYTVDMLKCWRIRALSENTSLDRVPALCLYLQQRKKNNKENHYRIQWHLCRFYLVKWKSSCSELDMDDKKMQVSHIWSMQSVRITVFRWKLDVGREIQNTSSSIVAAEWWGLKSFGFLCSFISFIHLSNNFLISDTIRV